MKLSTDVSPRLPKQGRNTDAAWRSALVVAVVSAVAVHALTDDRTLADVSYLGVVVGAAFVAWLAAAQAPPGSRLVARLIACGISFSALGDVTWTVLDRTGVDTTVSVADLGWGASYVALCAAMSVVLRRSPAPGRTALDGLVDVLTIVVVSVFFLWSSALEEEFASSGLSTFELSVWAAYPIADAVLLALVVRILVARRSRHQLSPAFAVGVSFWLAADFAYLYWPDDGATGTLMDAAWMVGPVLIACATWHSRSDEVASPDRAESGGQALQLLVAVGPLLVPPSLEVVADVKGDPDQPLLLLTSMVVLVALAFVRTARLVGSERRAHQELERARDAAVEASEAKSVFLANMGHEIRTPLTTVLAAAEMLGDTPLDDTQRRLLSRMDRCGELLRMLVERILDFSGLAADEVTLHPTSFDPSALIADIVDTYEERASAQHLEFGWYVDPRTPTRITADLVRVFQVLTNLLDNAFKFTVHGSVRVEVLPDDRGEVVRFLVTDTGIGIRDEDRGLVFDPFRQVDGSMTRSQGGTGLGLAICDQLATAMGGSIGLVSRLGEGSCFELRLPATAPAPTSPRPAHSPERSEHDPGLDRSTW